MSDNSNDKSSLRRDGVIPDVIDSEPIHKINLKYSSGVEVNYGTELKLSESKDVPQVDWPTETGVYYTLMMIDPDAPFRSKPLLSPINHWTVMNIPGTDISKGRTVCGYRGAGAPPLGGLHRYIFLVYKQSNGIIETNGTPVLNESFRTRIKFNIREWTKSNNLGEPVAVNYFQSQSQRSCIIL
ncbi:protein D2-like [Oppia nitens]|uniref:protein D2-like n=1 Tax=Oppia nitens TaxID=1686743 RepID=UPI0023DCDA96|nr:protein D2-like [Oppia nitens]